VIGNGNVAVDVARMLALTREELAPTDTTDPAIEAIASSPLREIVMLGRRGPAQAAFTTPELQELGELAGADVVVDPGELEGVEAPAGDTNATRNLEVLRAFAQRRPSGKPRTLRLRFLVSPVAILGDERVEAIEIVRNRLVDEGRRAEPTDERETIPCGLVFRSVGYRGVALPEVPFDESRGTIANDGGRVAPGVYCAGWIKRGPTGVIGTNKKDATETVQLLLDDARNGTLPRTDAGPDAVEALLQERGARYVLYAGWTSIDELERAAGEKQGRPRVKLVTWEDLLAAAETIASRT
jgi:ferredoxin--NADP+ reductase